MARSILMRYILVMGVLTFSQGCAMYPSDPSGFRKYEDIGTSAEIGEWALRQTEAAEIEGARYALLRRLERDLDSDAAFALTNIYLKLGEGWPGYQMPSGATEGEYVERDKRRHMQVIRRNLLKHSHSSKAAADALRLIEDTD